MEAHLGGDAGTDAQFALGVDAVLVGDDSNGQLAGDNVQLLQCVCVCALHYVRVQAHFCGLLTKICSST